jgi:hypothetical protein
MKTYQWCVDILTSCKDALKLVLTEGKLALGSLSKKLDVMNHEKREVFSLTCNNKKFHSLEGQRL